jgi:hypothetical protein
MKCKIYLKTIILLFVFNLLVNENLFSNSLFSINRLKYNGGGDWYADPTSLPNVLKNMNEKFGFNSYKENKINSSKNNLALSPFLYITGHGNIKLTETEIMNLKEFIKSGGFIYIDDCCGLDKYIKKILNRLLPESILVELPYSHKIYHSYYNFNEGPPKIHEHEGEPAKGFALFLNKKIAVFYTYSADIGCGVESDWVHNDSKKLRDEAMKMFSNIIIYNMLYN